MTSSQTRLHNAKPRNYKYNFKNTHPRVAKLEKATEKGLRGATNLNTRETRILRVLLESLEVHRAGFANVMAAKQRKVVLENRHRKITHKALQNSLKQGFLTLNQFQHSGFRTKIVADIEKELSPIKIKKRKLQKLSRRSLEETIAIGDRNRAILGERMSQKHSLTPITERVPSVTRTMAIPTLSRPITIPTGHLHSSGTKAGEHTKPTSNAKVKQTLRPIKVPKIESKLNINLPDISNDDDYDEGGFTPRPQQTTPNNLNKLAKIPSIVKEPSIFITAPQELS